MRTGFADFLSIARMAAAIPFSRGAIHRFFWPAICAALICIVASAQDPAPVLPRIAQDQLTALASRVADHIRKSQIDPAYPKLFVFDFPNQGSKGFTKLGSFLADRFSESLASQADGFVVSDRKLLNAYLKENRMDLKDVQEESIALALVRSMGATGVILGELAEGTGNQLRIAVRVVGFGPAWSDQAGFLLTEELQTWWKLPLPVFPRDSASIPLEPGVLRAGLDGVGVPECVDCPPPEYSGVARAAKFQGTVELSLVVNTEGRAESIFVLKGVPFLLNKQAIDAVQKWKFKPAEKNGKPVPVRVPIDITFRLY